MQIFERAVTQQGEVSSTHPHRIIFRRYLQRLPIPCVAKHNRQRAAPPAGSSKHAAKFRFNEDQLRVFAQPSGRLGDAFAGRESRLNSVLRPI
jgi:hypothetical protein